MKSRLLKIAAHQRCQLNIAAQDAAGVRLGYCPLKRRGRELRNVARWQRCGLDSEQEMLAIAMEKPCDVEENTDLDLMAVIHRLTAFRVNRIAYYGRVLP